VLLRVKVLAIEQLRDEKGGNAKSNVGKSPCGKGFQEFRADGT
jgi:hypothetical protein